MFEGPRPWVFSVFGRRTVPSFVVALWVVSEIVGCSQNVNVQSTGTVRYVQILDEVRPPALYARVGDEIRWLNLQSSPVRVGILHGAWDRHVACKKGFKRFGTMDDLVVIAPQEYVSLCFAKPATIRYNVWLEATNLKGSMSPTATIRID
jgi:hypothetical protein